MEGSFGANLAALLYIASYCAVFGGAGALTAHLFVLGGMLSPPRLVTGALLFCAFYLAVALGIWIRRSGGDARVAQCLRESAASGPFIHLAISSFSVFAYSFFFIVPYFFVAWPWGLIALNPVSGGVLFLVVSAALALHAHLRRQAGAPAIDTRAFEKLWSLKDVDRLTLFCLFFLSMLLLNAIVRWPFVTSVIVLAAFAHLLRRTRRAPASPSVSRADRLLVNFLVFILFIATTVSLHLLWAKLEPFDRQAIAWIEERRAVDPALRDCHRSLRELERALELEAFGRFPSPPHAAPEKPLDARALDERIARLLETGYLRTAPRCPAGGTLTLHRGFPVCSIHGTR